MFDIVNYSSHTGTFSAVNGLQLGGYQFSIHYNANAVELQVDSLLSATPEPGTWLMISCGLLALGLMQRRRRAA